MRTSDKPWYFDERYQGSLVSWWDTARFGMIGIFLGAELVTRPGAPERYKETMLRVEGPHGSVLVPTYTVRPISTLDDK